MNKNPARNRLIGGLAAAGLALALTACGGGGSSGAAPAASGGASTSATRSDAGSSQVLPVKENPIANTATAPGLTVTSVLVENNEDPATKKAVDDHLEIALQNTAAAALSGFEVYYTFTDVKTKASEGYYAKLGPEFTIPAGSSRTVNFDQTGLPDHYPDNKFSLYNSSKNALDVTVEISAEGVAVAKASVMKDAGGPENPDE